MYIVLQAQHDYGLKISGQKHHFGCFYNSLTWTKKMKGKYYINFNYKRQSEEGERIRNIQKIGKENLTEYLKTVTMKNLLLKLPSLFRITLIAVFYVTWFSSTRIHKWLPENFWRNESFWLQTVGYIVRLLRSVLFVMKALLLSFFFFH